MGLSVDSFTKIPNQLSKLAQEKKLKAIDIAVYYGIFSHKNQRNEACFPSLKTISEKINCSISTIQRSLIRLEKYGQIEHTYKKGRSNRYQVCSNRLTKYSHNDQVTIRNNKINYQGREKMLKALKDINPKAFRKFYE